MLSSSLDSHGTTDIKPEMSSGVQTGNGTSHDKYKIRGIAHPCKNRKDDIFMQTTSAKLYIYIGVGARDLYIDEAHMALDIFRFAAFLPTYA